MNSIKQLSCAKTTAEFPPLRQPKPDTADRRGTVRFGDGCITAEFPPHR